MLFTTLIYLHSHEKKETHFFSIILLKDKSFCIFNETKISQLFLHHCWLWRRIHLYCNIKNLWNSVTPQTLTMQWQTLDPDACSVERPSVIEASLQIMSKLKAGKVKMHMCPRGLGFDNLMETHQCVTAGLNMIPEGWSLSLNVKLTFVGKCTC